MLQVICYISCATQAGLGVSSAKDGSGKFCEQQETTLLLFRILLSLESRTRNKSGKTRSMELFLSRHP